MIYHLADPTFPSIFLILVHVLNALKFIFKYFCAEFLCLFTNFEKKDDHFFFEVVVDDLYAHIKLTRHKRNVCSCPFRCFAKVVLVLFPHLSIALKIGSEIVHTRFITINACTFISFSFPF